jgi:hypothetical protein
MDLNQYAGRTEALLTELVAELYRHGAGLKEELEISAIYERHRDLFAPDVVRALLARRDSPEARHLAEFAASGLLEHEVREITEQIATDEARATVPWDDSDVPWRQASVLIANEPGLARRHALEERTVAVTTRLDPQRASRLRRMHELAIELGFAGYAEMCDELGALHLAWLAPAMRELLDRTAAPHEAALFARLDAARIPRGAATTGDWNFLRRALEFDPLFPKDDLLPALDRTLRGLGIDLAQQANLHLDVEERPLKSPRAFCAPVRIPQEVWLVIRPHGGHDDYAAILHEAGHAEHFTHVDPDLPIAHRYLGDNSVTEAFAFLFNNLQRNRAWLREVMGATDVDRYLRLTHFTEVFMLRRYAAKLHYELELHAAPEPQALAPRYAELLSDVLKVRVWPENALFDVDDGLYVACYLRAWIFEVQLRRALTDRFGDRWFADPSAGDFLTDLWRLGQQHSADELAQKLGYDGLDAGPLTEELTEGYA